MSVYSKIILRKDLVKEGFAPLYLQIGEHIKVKKISLQELVKVSQWDAKRQMVKGKSDKIKLQNERLQAAVSRVSQIKSNLAFNGQAVTLDKVIAEYKKEARPLDFFQYAQTYIENLKRDKRSNDYIRGFISVINNLRNKYISKIDIRNIDRHWLEEYRRHLTSVEELEPWTVWFRMKTLRTVLLSAKSDGLIIHNPFENITLTKPKTKRTWLNKQELVKLIALYENTALPLAVSRVLQCFLFSCFTGLRKKDIANLTYRNIQDGYVYIKMNKTQTPLHILIPDKAKEFIPEFPDNLDKKVFNFRKNPNKPLQKAIDLAGIQKHITFHCARHTYAMVGLNDVKMDMKAVSKNMGHTDMRTTQIYAELQDEYVQTEQAKWNKVFSSNGKKTKENNS